MGKPNANAAAATTPAALAANAAALAQAKQARQAKVAAKAAAKAAKQAPAAGQQQPSQAATPGGRQVAAPAGFNVAPTCTLTPGQASGTNKWAYLRQPCLLACGTPVNRTVYIAASGATHIVVGGRCFNVVLNAQGLWQVNGPKKPAAR